MLEIKAKLKVPRAAYRLEVKGQLKLRYASRCKHGLETKLVSGEAVVLRLPRGEVLRGGDLVTASDGRVIEVVALPEKLLHVVCASAAQLARTAWHLGSDHIPAEIGEGFLRVAADRALAEKLRQSGATVSEVEAPFEPEAAAGEPHAQGHDHDHGKHKH
jgi:urease accessory protein